MRKHNKLIYFNNTVYALSKDFGFKCDLYRQEETLDHRTGRTTRVRHKFKIKKAIFFPSQLFRDFNYAALFGKDMQFGGILDVSQRRVLINKKYLPKGFNIDVNDYVIFNGKRYEIQKIDELELADYWHLIIKQTVGVPKGELFEISMSDTLTIEEYVL